MESRRSMERKDSRSFRDIMRANNESVTRRIVRDNTC